MKGLTAVAFLAAALPSCSLIFVDGPPPDHAARPYFDCTSGRLAPVADAVGAGLVALGTLGAASDSPPGSNRVEGAVLGSAIALGFLGSSVRGWTSTAACREAKTELAARLTGGPAAVSVVPFVPRPDPWLAAGPPPAAQSQAQGPSPAPSPAPAPDLARGAPAAPPSPPPPSPPTRRP